MSKDPAFLLYPQDFLVGTMTMTNEQVGKYVRLLCLQHQTGHLTEDDMLDICDTKDAKIWRKFKQDGDGLYYNERLQLETNKRRKYSESRRNNRASKNNIYETYDVHMENENENVNINVSKDKSKKGKSYRSFAHLSLSNEEFESIKATGYTKQRIDDILDSIENFKNNTKYKSLNLTVRSWLKKEKEKVVAVANVQPKYEPIELTDNPAPMPASLRKRINRIGK